MKNRIHLMPLVAALMLSLISLNLFAQNQKPFVIPELKEWKGAEGVFVLDKTTPIVAVGEAEAVATAFVEDLKMLKGFELGTVQKVAAAPKGKAPQVLFLLKADKKQRPEGYTIKIGEQVEVSAPSKEGLYWASRTLLQMLDGNCKMELVKGEINDSPDFGMRGFMIDCGRKYIPMSYLRKLVRIMGYYKMNTLQVHLNDNGFPKHFENDWQKTYAAFRLECNTYPDLTARDGFYTKKEFRELQKLAEENGVEIIPEIDAPAHSLAFTHYDPELASHKYGIDHLDITNPKSLKFVTDLWDEYLSGDDPVFQGPRVHIGTDEYSNRDQDVVELFRHFTDSLIKHVEAKGKQACVWGSLTHAKGQTLVKVDNVLMSLWSNGFADPDSMLKMGYKGISIPDGLVYIVPAAGYYYDYLNCQYLYERWTPNLVGNNVFAYESDSIVGGMFAVWNDICGNGISVKDIHHRVYPAMQTLSAKFWTGRDVTLPFAEFDKQRKALHEAPGINELGRIGCLKATEPVVLAADDLKPSQLFQPKGFKEVGYDYTVEFDLNYKAEPKGTVLLESENAKFYLADPINGCLGYERDGYLYTFDLKPFDGEKMKIAIEGNNKWTKLYVNGRMVEQKNGRTYWTDGKGKVMTVETLVFPLQSTGDFRSEVKNFKVTNTLLYTK